MPLDLDIVCIYTVFCNVGPVELVWQTSLEQICYTLLL